MSEIDYIKELPESIFPVNLKLIYQYQEKYPSLIAKYKTGTFKTVLFVEEEI